MTVTRGGRLHLGATLVEFALLPVALAACAREDPTGPPASRGDAPSDFALDATPTASNAPGAADATPADAVDADPAILPQTRDRPRSDGQAFEARVNALWKAIVEDEPDRAMIFFFPLAAYRQVKDVANPTADWKHRLVAAFARDIHALHARLPQGCMAASQSAAGHTDAGRSRCRLVNLEVPAGAGSTNAANAKWVAPGEEYNKIGYYRVFGSKLRYEVDGAARGFDVKSLISWRGEWYVVHLSAI